MLSGGEIQHIKKKDDSFRLGHLENPEKPVVSNFSDQFVLLNESPLANACQEQVTHQMTLFYLVLYRRM